MADSPEIQPEQVEEFAQAARQMIDARLLRAQGGERLDFWSVVAMIYARGLAKESPAEVQDRPEPTALVRVTGRLSSPVIRQSPSSATG